MGRAMAAHHHHRSSKRLDIHLVFAFICALTLVFCGQAARAQSNDTSSDANQFDKTGSNCNVSNSLLLTASNQLMTDCGYMAWCDPTTSKCAARGCRREEYPFGYSTVERSKWPPKCDSHEFCPDEGSLCMEKIELGGGCQLNRDDECATSSSAPNVRCLHNICTSVNASLGAACIHENVVYTVFTPDNSSYGSIVSRDNCMNGLYCDSPTSICIQRKPKGQSCAADKECMTDFCQDKSYTANTPDNNDSTGTCAEQPFFTANRHQIWVYPVIIIVAVVVLLILIGTLLKVHQSQGVRRREKARAYWESQRLISEKARLFKEDKRQKSISGSPLLSGSNMGSRPRSYGTAGSLDQLRSPTEENRRLLRSDSPAGPSTHASYDATYTQSSAIHHTGLTESYPVTSSPHVPGQTFTDHPGDDSAMMNTTIAGMHGHQQEDDSTDADPVHRSSSYARIPNNQSNISLGDSPRANEPFLTPSQSRTSLIAGTSDFHDASSMYGTPGHHPTMRNRESVARNAPFGSPDARRESVGNEWFYHEEQRK